MAKEGKDIIKIEKFSFKYAGSEKYVLRNISLTIKKGEFIVVAGPSGSGKTTLARAIVGLIPHFYSGEYSGNIYVDGKLVRETTINEITQTIGYVFQNPDNQLFMSTVLKDVAFRLEYSNISRNEIFKRVRKVLDDLNISHLSNCRIDELSGGEKQKVAIAGVLVSQPKVIILDEPTAYLSPKSVCELICFLEKLNLERNITIILIDHRLDLIINAARRLIVIYDSQIVLDSPPSEALKLPLDRLYGLNIPTISKLYRVISEKWKITLPSPLVSPEEYAYYINKVINND